MEFKENIKILRKEYNLSQEELAQKLGIARSSVANYENGQNFPNMDILIKLSKIFNCTIDYILGNSDIRNEEELRKKALDEFHNFHEKELKEKGYYVDDFGEFYEQYKKLNALGQAKIKENIEDLNKIDKYTESQKRDTSEA